MKTPQLCFAGREVNGSRFFEHLHSTKCSKCLAWFIYLLCLSGSSSTFILIGIDRKVWASLSLFLLHFPHLRETARR